LLELSFFLIFFFYFFFFNFFFLYPLFCPFLSFLFLFFFIFLLACKIRIFNLFYFDCISFVFSNLDFFIVILLSNRIFSWEQYLLIFLMILMIVDFPFNFILKFIKIPTCWLAAKNLIFRKSLTFRSLLLLRILWRFISKWFLFIWLRYDSFLWKYHF